jgi:hypothetical protein
MEILATVVCGVVQYLHLMKPLEKNIPETPQHHPHTFRTLTLWLIILVVVLVAFLLLMGNLSGPSRTDVDPAAQFLQDNTRADISEQDITNAGNFLQQTTETIPEQQVQDLNNFLDNQS